MQIPTGELEEVKPPRKRRPRAWGVSAALVIVVASAMVVVDASRPHAQFGVVVLSSASARTTGSGTAHMRAVETVTFGGTTETLVHVDGGRDFTHKAGSITVFDRFDDPIETVRDVGGVSYISAPRPGVPLPGGAHWVSITPADLKLSAGLAKSMGSNDPSSGLAFFSAVNGAPRVVDTDPLDGVDVVHYAFTLDVESLFDHVGAESKAAGVPAFASALEQLKSLIDLTKLPGQAWIDSEGRVRRFTVTFEVSQGGQTMKVVSDLRFSNFGEPFAVAAPGAADTVPFASVPHFLRDLANAAAVSTN
jgi:hypothetical protein